MRHRILHALMTVAAAVVLLAGATKANAQCCDRVIIDNLSSCNFQVCIYLGTTLVECRTLIAGSNLFDLPTCDAATNINVQVVDRCNNPVWFPVVGQCADIPITAACCIHVCSPASGCFYEITDGICAAGC